MNTVERAPGSAHDEPRPACAARPRTDTAQAGQTGQPADWHAANPSELIAHILGRYHARHREQLPELILLARRVELVHAGRPGCPSGLATHLSDMRHELESHMAKEEQVLFPMLGRGQRPEGPIAVMRFEHTQHSRGIERLDALTNHLRPPPDACNTWRKLYLGLAEFRDDLIEHIDLENDFLFQPVAPETSHA